MNAEDYGSVEEFVAENQEMLVRVLRHSNNAYSRACAWALLDAGLDAPELERIKRELSVLQKQRGVS